jgi:hypothetical protein
MIINLINIINEKVFPQVHPGYSQGRAGADCILFYRLEIVTLRERKKDLTDRNGYWKS